MFLIANVIVGTTTVGQDCSISLRPQKLTDLDFTDNIAAHCRSLYTAWCMLLFVSSSVCWLLG